MIVAKINKDQGEEILTVGTKGYTGEKVPFTSPRLNYLLYGGLPSNKAIEIFGPEHGGKTTTALDMVKNVQEKEDEIFLAKQEDLEKALLAFSEKGDSTSKQYKEVKESYDRLIDDGPRKCVYVDAENTLDADWAEKLGVDVQNMILVRPKEQSAEQVLQMILDIIDSGQVACLVVDSWPMLVPKSIFEESMEKKSYCGISGPLSIFCSKLVGLGRLAKNNTMLIGINQVREDIENPYNQFNTPGGRAWRHLCTVRLMVRHGSWFGEDNTELANKDAKTPLGNNVEVSVVKNKCGKSDRRVGFYRLNYNKGIDSIADMLDIAILCDLVQKTGSWYILPGEIKVQGLKAVNAYFAENPEKITEMYTLVNQRIAE